MKVFCHINDLRERGFASLRVLTLAFEHVVLWGPSFTFLDDAGKNSPLLPDGEELLDHVLAGRISLIAREWWFDRAERTRKSTQWSGIAWHRFDDEILRILVEDQGRGADARVRVVPRPGHTLHTIRALVNERQWETHQIAQRATAELPGYLDRMRHPDHIQDPSLSLIKDAVNHGYAFRDSGADRVFGIPHDDVLYAIFAEVSGDDVARDFVQNMPSHPATSKLVGSLEHIIGLVELTGQPPTSRDAARHRINQLLADQASLGQLRSWFAAADETISATGDQTYGDLVGSLLEELDAMQPPMPQRVWHLVKRLSPSRGAALVFEILGKLFGFDLFVKISQGLSSNGNLLRPRKALPAGYSGPTWPLYLSMDARDPSADATIIAELRKLLRNTQR